MFLRKLICIWISISFLATSFAISIVSEVYSEKDYVRDYAVFKEMVQNGFWK